MIYTFLYRSKDVKFVQMDQIISKLGFEKKEQTNIREFFVKMFQIDKSFKNDWNLAILIRNSAQLDQFLKYPTPRYATLNRLALFITHLAHRIECESSGKIKPRNKMNEC